MRRGFPRAATWPSRPDQDDRTRGVVTGDDVEVGPERPQRGVAQHAGRVSRGDYQDVAAAAQDAVQRGVPAARADPDVGHALPGARPAPAAAPAGQSCR